MSSDKNMAGAIVLYWPGVEVLSNIQSYIDKIDVLYAIDNSSRECGEVVHELKRNPKIIYIFNNQNLGIAQALNLAAEKATAQGCRWLLTMDQDTSFDARMTDAYFDAFGKIDNKEDIAVAAPSHSSPSVAGPMDEYREVETVWTSGSLLNLGLFDRVGRFDEKLFIDAVDHDYCLRAKLKNYRIIQFVNICMNHRLGETKTFYRQGRRSERLVHSPIRWYYIVRNNLYMWKKYHREYPQFTRLHAVVLRNRIRDVVLYEKKPIKVLYMLRGLFDFLIGRYGRL